MNLFINCEYCAGRFIPARSTARFCSSKCRVYWNRRKFPAALTERDAWVRADGKRPIQADGSPASSTNRSTWAAYADVQRSKAGDGLGIMLGDGLGCYDLDKVPDADARDFIAEIPEPIVFIERSMSGRGFHVFVEAPEEKGWKRGHVEKYSRARFIRVTGDVFTA